MLISRALKRTAPLALGGALAVTLLTTPAFASSGWWYSNGGGAKGFYNHVNGRVIACDIKTDGYSAVTQILTKDGYLLTSVVDKLNNGACSWRTPTLFEGEHKIRVCLVKSGQKPTKCSPAHRFYV
ncbi:hypothetical protein ACFVOR_34935 [Streptomyces sp. NPDC057837]|uniref:hypothetical protein n=1 Tax=unclassified Streptomyces TaxID=2593676 RepID=UPI00222FEBA3|nr:hypothetical protein [Streptomyces sp. A012304]GKQ33586.1 hypothetical protein ALMP_01370 [Streptomyces sp. A012304]